MIEVPMHANRAENGVGLSGGTVDIESIGDQAIDHVLDLAVGSTLLHDDNHEIR
jgi:hypothetical protein